QVAGIFLSAAEKPVSSSRCVGLSRIQEHEESWILPRQDDLVAANRDLCAPYADADPEHAVGEASVIDADPRRSLVILRDLDQCGGIVFTVFYPHRTTSIL